jgi:hypothetical protein
MRLGIPYPEPARNGRRNYRPCTTGIAAYAACSSSAISALDINPVSQCPGRYPIDGLERRGTYNILPLPSGLAIR